MSENAAEYLTTKEVAELLRIKERKVYDLAASSDIPCTRALGKLLFSRRAIEGWLAQHESGAAVESLDFPSVLLGSHDPLLEWCLRESRSGIASYVDGSLDGLDRFANAEGIATGLHVFDPDTDDWNVAEIKRRFQDQPVVLVEWAWRERGLIVSPGNPRKFMSIADLGGSRVVPRQSKAGSQVLFAHLLADAGLSSADLELIHAARTETDAALAVQEGQADAAFGLMSAASQYRLDFVPVIRERFDLLVWRSQWFEEPFQRLLALSRSELFRERVSHLPGYDATTNGRVHFNGRAR